MAEDLSQWVEYATDGTPKVKPGIGALPPMTRPPATAGKATTGKAAEPSVHLPDLPKGKATGDRFRILNGFVDCSLADLTRSEIAVWLILYRDTRDGTVRGSQSNIARRAGLTVRGVQKALDKLTGRGLVRVIFKGGLNRGPSRYRVEPLTNRGS
jgi:hypothetical protein